MKMRRLALSCEKKSAQIIEKKGPVFALSLKFCLDGSREGQAGGTTDAGRAFRSAFFVNEHETL
jgi:hypothetical protein